MPILEEKEQYHQFPNVDENAIYDKLDEYFMSGDISPEIDALLDRMKWDLERGYLTQGQYEYITLNVDAICDYYKQFYPFNVKIKESNSLLGLIKEATNIIPNFSGIINCPWPAVEVNLGIEQKHTPDECYTARCPYFGGLIPQSGNVRCVFLDRSMLWR